MAVERLTEAELFALPVTVDVVTAGRAWGHGRRKSYAMARSGDFPFPVHRDGQGMGRLTVAKADLLRSLGYDAVPAAIRAA